MAADNLDALIHDATSVFRFVDFICDFCYQQENHHVYSDASLKFFRYIRHLGSSTQKHIQVEITDASTDSSVVPIYRTGLATIKECWGRVHEFVKLVADGHSLQTPAPLLDFMEGQLAALPGLAGTRIVILLSEELNYLQYQHGKLKNFAVDFSLTIPDAPPFPEKLAFIGIPFSQRATVFTNTLIYHELGHFAFEELKKRVELDPYINAALDQQMHAKYDAMSRKEKRWHQDKLAAWAEEAFCDLFAIWLIGPAYAFASIELLSLLNVLTPNDAKDFDTDHPCDAYRFSEHINQLETHKWWDEIAGLDCEHPTLMKDIAAIDPATYTSYPPDPLFDNELIPAFLRLRQNIRNLVKNTVADCDSGLAGFKQVRGKVTECLSAGVVPSVTYDRKIKVLVPGLINASFAFYLESMPSLIKMVTGPGPLDIEHRSKMSNRLELWILKAIEDCNLMARYWEQKESIPK
jgi:hypothetical protein